MRLYGNAFSAEPGRCFRWIYREDTGQPQRCTEVVSTRGWWQDAVGLWWAVDSCREHSEQLAGRRPGPGARFGVRQPAPRSRGHNLPGGRAGYRLLVA